MALPMCRIMLFRATCLVNPGAPTIPSVILFRPGGWIAVQAPCNTLRMNWLLMLRLPANMAVRTVMMLHMVPAATTRWSFCEPLSLSITKPMGAIKTTCDMPNANNRAPISFWVKCCDISKTLCILIMASPSRMSPMQKAILGRMGRASLTVPNG